MNEGSVYLNTETIIPGYYYSLFIGDSITTLIQAEEPFKIESGINFTQLAYEFAINDEPSEGLGEGYVDDELSGVMIFPDQIRD